MAESDERITKLLEKLNSNDQEKKVDAINKLQAEFGAGLQPIEAEEVIAALKASVRISNQHIYTASLSAIAALFPVLVTSEVAEHSTFTAHDVAALRHGLLAFLSPGGILDRLGDNREKARDCAREALVSAGNIAFKYSPPTPVHLAKSTHGAKGQETPIAIFERSVRDLGFGSKVSRVREQTILTLVHLRRTNQQFPLRPFLTHLVDTLEDSDGGVRDCARASVIEMFTAPTVTDGARADLKKEMTKKGVRKGIMDGILNQLLASGSSLAVDTPMEEGPRASTSSMLGSRKPTSTSFVSTSGSSRTMSVASSGAANEVAPGTPTEETEAIVSPVYIASARDLEHEFANMAPPFEGRESEHNWLSRDRAVTRVRGMLKGDVHLRFPDAFMEGLKSGFVSNSLKTLASLRTVVATNSCGLYVDLVNALGPAYEPFVELTLTPLFRMGALTKKIVAIQTQATAKEILLHANCHPKIVLSLLWLGVQDKNLSVRQYSLEHINTVLETSAVRTKALIESTGGVELLEKSIKRSLADQNAGVREKARATFWAFDRIWKDSANAIAGTLNTIAQKQLEKAAPTGQVSHPTSSSAAEQRKSSVAAAIAASRAKAKQIAAAPPTLRHAATSHASTMASNARHPASPTSPPATRSTLMQSSPAAAKRMSAAFTRSATSPGLTNVNLRSPSSNATKSNSSLSPPSSPTQPPSQRLPASGARVASAVTSPTTSHIPIRSPPRTNIPLRSSLSARSASPPVNLRTTPQIKRASGVFSSPRATEMTPMPVANDTLTFSPHPSDDESLMRMRAPGSEAGSDESLPMASFSDAYTSTPPGMTAEMARLTRSTNPVKVPGPVIEDDLRARAEQAESAAERLLEELVEPDDTVQNIHLPPSLVQSISQQPNGGSTPRPLKQKNTIKGEPAPPMKNAPPVTPANKMTSMLRQGAAFQDSPAYKSGSHSIVDRLKDNRNESSWWLKRVTLLQQQQVSLGDNSDQAEELKRIIGALEAGNATPDDLKQLIVLCSRNPAVEEEDSSLGMVPIHRESNDIWENGLLSYRLLAALSRFLTVDKNEEVLEYGLIVLWEMLENQQAYLEGRESQLLSLLFHLRYSNAQTVAEASNTIRDSLVARIDPVYGLTTMHASLKKFLSEPIPPSGTAENRALSHAFGLLAIGKFILRLPAEVLEEELPRLQLTLSQGLNDAQLLVRESAAAAITAAQLVLRDETYLFTMLASLSEEKKNLLTYLFDKHGARGAVEGVTAGNLPQGGLDRLEKEMRRLDSRTSTPLRRP